MKKSSFITIACTLFLSALTALATPNDPYLNPAYKANVARWDKDFAQFQKEVAENPVPEGAIIGIGSSSMKGWHKHIRQDLAPLTIIPRGFGGSNLNDAVYALDKIVLPLKPRAILLYEGDNDIAAKVAPEEVLKSFGYFTEKVWNELPETRIYVLSIKPSIRRWNMWPQMAETNELLKKACEKDPRLTYIDVATPMLDENGEPIESLFLNDKLHMTRAGYELWASVVRPVLMEKESKYESDMSNK